MKTIILAGVAALYVGSAHADQLPKQMLGNWCPITAEDTAPAVYIRGTSCPNYEFQLKRNELSENFGGEEEGCDLKSIKRLFRDSYLVRATCEAQLIKSRADIIIQIVDNQLVIKYSPFVAQYAVLSALIVRWELLNEVCYHDYGKPICKKMDPIGDKISARGWCFGKVTQARGYWKWHRCTSNSFLPGKLRKDMLEPSRSEPNTDHIPVG
jgi:hypothetical protein